MKTMKHTRSKLKRPRLQHKILDQLNELYENEHGGCDDATCDMHSAFEHGYTCWAIKLFASSGAASNEFCQLYYKLNSAFTKQADLECDEFIKNVEHIECIHCNQITWEPQWVNGYCYSCNKDEAFTLGASNV